MELSFPGGLARGPASPLTPLAGPVIGCMRDRLPAGWNAWVTTR